MKSPQHGRSSVKRDGDDNSEVRSEGDRENETWEGEDKRAHRTSKSRRSLPIEVDEGVDISGRRSTGERNESRKRSGDSSRAGSDEDYVNRDKSRSKQITRKQEESTLMKLSNWYQDGELDGNHESRHKKMHDQVDESERKEGKLSSSDHEFSQRKIRGKDGNSPEASVEKAENKESRHDERRGGSQGKDHESADQGRTLHKIRRSEDNSYMEKVDVRSGKSSDAKHESTRDKIASPKLEASQSKGMDLDSTGNKVSTSYDREQRRNSSEKSRSKVNSEPLEEDRGIYLSDEDTAVKDRVDNPTHHRNSPGQNTSRSHELSSMEKDAWTRDSKRDSERSNRSRTPERSGRYHHESEKSERNHEQSMSFRQKEEERDFLREDRPRGRADSWNDKNRDREGSRDSWKQRNSHDRETKDGDNVADRGREWEMQKYGRESGERLQGRLAGRKESRTEAVKTSSKYGISNENYDVIEIQTKPFDYGAEKSASTYGRKSEGGQQPDTMSARNNSDWLYPQEDAARRTTTESGLIGDDFGVDVQGGARGQQGVTKRSASGQSSGGGSQPPYGNQEAVSSSRNVSGAPQGLKGGRGGRGWGRPMGRDSPQPGPGVPMPMMGSPFGPLGLLPAGPMNPMNPGMSPVSVPPVSPGVFIPPFSPPIGWPGPRGVEMNMLAVPPGHPLSSGTPGSRFPPTLGTPQSPAMYFNHPGPGRGLSPNAAGPGFNSAVPMGRGQTQEKLPGSGGWMPPRNNGGIGKAPSRGEQNDYSQNFVDTGMRPQNFIRELELTSVVEDYPKLRDLIQRKDEIVANAASPPMYYKCDLREMELSPEFFGTKFDVILVDPPWEEYVHRAPGVTDHMEYWTLEEIMNLKIEAIADTPSFIFLWVGDGVGLEQGRQCLKKWGFRRCEDICWVKTNKTTATPGLRHDSHTLFQRSKEHCLMGIKGTVRRSSDGHIIHANIDTDVIIAEEPPYGSTAKPEDMYRIIEHFALGRRRLELFGEDHNIRSGWMTVGKALSSSNFDAKAYIKNFADKDGKVWQGGGRNPPPEAPHLVLTTPEIEALRPKSPMKNQQQQQQQSASISISTANSSSKRPSGNVINLTQEASSSNNMSAPGPWMEGFRDRGGNNNNPAPSDDRTFDNSNMMF